MGGADGVDLGGEGLGEVARVGPGLPSRRFLSDSAVVSLLDGVEGWARVRR